MKAINAITRITTLFTCFIAALVFACNEEDSEVSNNLRILKVISNGEDLSNGAEVKNKGLEIEIVFSHSLDTSAFESALSIDASGFNISYNETNSFVTIIFPPLDYETQYTINLPAGDYGLKDEKLQADYSFSFITKVFVPSKVTLTVDNSSILEGENAMITVQLNEATTEDVTIRLSFDGNATMETDYTVSATSIVITERSTSESVDLMALTDLEFEGEESVLITIKEVINGVGNDKQQVNISINDEAPALIIKGVMALRWSTETDDNSGKAVHLVATKNIADLSIYSLGIANNGEGSGGIDYTLPAGAANAGDDILIAREPAALEAYFAASCYSAFERVFQTDEMEQDGNDAIELFNGMVVIETYGDVNTDGSGQDWDYTGFWAYKLGEDWITGSVDCSVGSTGTLDSDCIYPLCDHALILKGVLALLWDGSGTNGGKALHLLATRDIADLSLYGIGVANNGGGTDGKEYIFPAMAVSEGDHILLAREVNTLSGYFGSCFNGFDHIFQAPGDINQNGDDAIELFEGANIIETYGDAGIDGTGQLWDYTGSWAYKIGSAWTYGGINCAATSITTQSSDCPYLFCE